MSHELTSWEILFAICAFNHDFFAFELKMVLELLNCVEFMFTRCAIFGLVTVVLDMFFALLE